MLLDDERLKSILEDVAKKLKVDKKWRYVIKKLDEEIVNYSGNLRLISLIDKTNDKVYKLICKTPPNWAMASIVDAIVINEYHAYSTLFPIFKSLKSSVDVDNLFPECYYIDSKPDNRVLVFQDMTSKGFERRHGNNFDFNHMTVTLETIAKYHALSFILRENDICNVYVNRLKSFSEKRPECLFEFIKHFVDEWLPVFKDKYYVHVLEGISKNIERNMEECVAKAKGLVYGHGDLWKENILFKYSNGKPVDACLIDFQHSRLSNIAQDILSFLMTATDAVDRKIHFRYYLNHYYQSLQKILNSNGLEGSKIYTQTDFEYDLKLVFPVSLFLAIFSFIVWFAIEDLDCFLSMKKDKACPGDKRLKERGVSELIRMTDELISDFIDHGYLPELRK